MNTGKYYNTLLYGNIIEKSISKMKVLKGWLLNSKMKQSHKVANRSILIQYIDFLYSILIYGTTLEDYLLFEFYNKKHDEKKDYATGKKMHSFFSQVNNEAKTDIFIDKIKFERYFSQYVGRGSIVLNLDGENKEDANNWLKNKKTIFAKPSKGVEGRGIVKFNVRDTGKIISYCLENKLDLLEEAIEQHPDMVLIHPKSVNTIRFMTLVTDGEVNFLGARLRVGNGKSVDNFSEGGLAAGIDIKTGCVNTLAYSNNDKGIFRHPLTKVEFEGFQIPLWNEVIEMCKNAALVVPEVRTVGWDIAITPEGPIIVEGNDRWGRFIWQLPVEKGLYTIISDNI